MLDGEALSYNEPSGGDWDPNLLLAFDSVGLRVGSSGFRGHLYAFGIFDSYLTDADVELLETWAQDARALCYDSRGTRVGSRQP